MASTAGTAAGACPSATPSGEVVKWIGTATDIDDHKTSRRRSGRPADRLAEAQRLAHVGSWSVDVGTGKHTWSDELYRLLGYEPQEFEPDQERVFERLHPDDASRVRAACLGQVSRAEAWEDEFRIVLPDGDGALAHGPDRARPGRRR